MNVGNIPPSGANPGIGATAAAGGNALDEMLSGSAQSGGSVSAGAMGGGCGCHGKSGSAACLSGGFESLDRSLLG